MSSIISAIDSFLRDNPQLSPNDNDVPIPSSSSSVSMIQEIQNSILQSEERIKQQIIDSENRLNDKIQELKRSTDKLENK